MKSRLHVDEFVDSGGLALAAELGSVSADHVACSNDDSRVSAAESGTVQTFLPGTPYVLGKSLELPIKKCITEDWPFSIATDFNPNCPITSLPLIGSFVTHRLGVDPIASLVAVTRNPATTMFDEEEPRGVISEGSIADMNVLWSSSADSWCQTPGSSPVRRYNQKWHYCKLKQDLLILTVNNNNIYTTILIKSYFLDSLPGNDVITQKYRLILCR